MAALPGAGQISPRGDETRGGAQTIGFRFERRQRGVGLGDQCGEPGVRAVDAERGDERRLAGGGILAGCLPSRAGVALDVEQVVGDLEGLAERAP